MLPFEAIK